MRFVTTPVKFVVQERKTIARAVVIYGTVYVAASLLEKKFANQ
jgi:hypothetical protein